MPEIEGPSRYDEVPQAPKGLADKELPVSGTDMPVPGTMDMGLLKPKNPSIDSGIPNLPNTLDAKKKLVGTPELFRDSFKGLTGGLEKNLQLPQGMLEAIAWRESQFGSNNLGAGSMGMLQLTKWPFEDIGCVSGGKRLNNRSVFDKKYAAVFQKITPDMIDGIGDPSVKIYMKGLVDAANNPGVPVNDIYDVAMGLKKSLISAKNKDSNFHHEANMMLGAVYLRAGASQQKLPDALGKFKSALANLQGISGNMKGEKVSPELLKNFSQSLENNPKVLNLAILLANYNTKDTPASKEEGKLGHKYYYAMSILLYMAKKNPQFLTQDKKG